MRKLTIFAAVALIGASAVGAHAQCAFDGPAKAKGMKTSLVRAYAGCPSITFAGPNSQTGGGTPTCAPPYATSQNYVFDDAKGSCDFKTKGKVEAPCEFNSVTRPCFNLSLQAKCKGITHPDTSPIDGGDDAGWSLSTVSRATLDDEDNGDMTVINFPVNVAFDIPSNGGISVKTDTNHILDDLGLPSLVACTQVEVVSLSIQDPDGAPFAVMGAGTRE